MAIPWITWEDAQQMPEDGRRYEAIGGVLYVTAAPRLHHQSIVGRLYLSLHELLVAPGHGRLWLAPVGVEFPATGEGVQPDLVFVSTARDGIVAPEGLRGAPELVVEVASPSTAHRDRGVKLRLYEQQGVGEYWIVDPKTRAVDVWRFGGEPRHERFTARLPVLRGAEAIGEIDLVGVFAPD
jgi:Uma2 family endonuclease